MFNRLLPLFIMWFFVTDVLAINSDNPFDKTQSLNIGKDISWKIDTDAVQATKTATDGKGLYYHLQFDNKQLSLFVSSDASGLKPKKFSQFEVKNVKIDGKQSPLFNWCLNNQERHNRFLQQGLKVKNNLCAINGDTGSFVMQLNKDELRSLQKANRLLIVLKPFRTPLELHYDIGDFKDMHLALNTKPLPAVTTEVPVKKVIEQTRSPAKKAKKKCWFTPPANYKKIKSVGYECDNAAAKRNAEVQITALVNKEKAKQQQLAAEKEKQRKLEEQKRQKELAEKLKQEELLKAEAAAIAASKEKQAEIGSEITQKMVKVCDKFWNKGEHRCYCQKYIEFAPAEIQANPGCN